MPRSGIDGRHRRGLAQKVLHARADRHVGLVDASQLGRIRVHVHEFLLRAWRRQQRVALGGRLAEARADGDDQIGITYKRADLG